MILLGWGVLAAGYLLAGPDSPVGARRPGAEDSAPERPDEDGGLAAYRGDGALASWIGALVDGRLPPLPPLLVGLLVTGVLAALGLGNLPGILVLTPVEAMMLAALGARHPHDGRLDWLVPALLLTGEGVFLAALGLARHVTPWVVFALLAAVLVRHVDLACRARAGRGIPADVFGLGWEGRMLLAGVAAVAGIVPFAYAALSGYLWLLFIWDFLSGWLARAAPALSGRRRRLIGMVLAAGAGRRLRPDTDALPKALLPVDRVGQHGEVTILDIALRNLAAVGLRDIVVVVGYAADAVRDRAAALEREHGVRLTLVRQRPGRGVEQRLLALAGPRPFRRGRAAGQRGHGAPRLGREDAARRGRPGGHRHRRRRRQAPRRRGDEGDHRPGRPPEPGSPS